MKYLVQWKGFTAEYNSWEKEEDLENARELVTEFEGRIDVEVRKQEKFRYGRGKRLQERGVTRKIYGKNII